MPLRNANFKANTGALPIYHPSAATLAFAALPGRLAWLEGDRSFIGGSHWHDRATNAPAAIAGNLVGGRDLVGGRGAAGFSDAQSVDLGAIFPVGSDYSVFAVFRQSSLAGHTAILLGSNDANYHILGLTLNGNVVVSNHGPGGYTGASSHPLDALRSVAIVYKESGRLLDVYHNRTLEAGAYDLAASVTDASAIVGNNPGMAGRTFRGSLYHMSIFARALTADDRAAVDAYLTEQFGP